MLAGDRPQGTQAEWHTGSGLGGAWKRGHKVSVRKGTQLPYVSQAQRRWITGPKPHSRLVVGLSLTQKKEAKS